MINFNIKTNNINTKEYVKLINILFDKCIYFTIASLYNYSPPPCFRDKLISTSKSKQWEGTKSSKKANIYKFALSPQIKEYMLSKKGFLSLKDGAYVLFGEGQEDIAFYTQKECLLYTISHEGEIYISDAIKF